MMVWILTLLLFFQAVPQIVAAAATPELNAFSPAPASRTSSSPSLPYEGVTQVEGEGTHLLFRTDEKEYPPSDCRGGGDAGHYDLAGDSLREGVAPTALPVEGATRAPIIAQRFFRMGDGKVHIRNAHNGLDANVRLLKQDGSLDQQALDEVDKVFGYSPREKGSHISLRLLFFLDYFSDRIAAGKILHLESGYRNPEYNQRLRKLGRNVALTSAHMDAMAIDFFIDGVSGKRLWEMIRKEECCGVGHYGGRTIHLDSGRPRFWEAATSKVTSDESESNRRIYLSTQYDRYKPGEMIGLSLVSISDFGFGIMPGIDIVGENGMNHTANLTDSGYAGGTCMLVKDRKYARSLGVSLPEQISPGRYRLLVRFCNRPSTKMPAEILSNVIEVMLAK